MIKLVNVSKFYSSNNVIAMGLRKANLELSVNEFVAIVGESGSGKTTLLNVICGIDTYEEGEIYFNGEETSYFNTAEMENFRKKYVAFVFQNYNLIDSYTVLQNVEAPMILAGYAKKEVRRRALEIIERVGLTNHLHHKATKLSGGQKQRVVIARALAKNCPIIAADEPTGNLDSESGKQILELLYEISKDKLVIMVTHDYDQVKQYATRKIRIYDGEIVEDVVIKKADKQPIPVIPDTKVSLKFSELLRMSLNNLMSVPKKTILLFLVMLLTTFFVAWMYGTYARTTSDTQDYSTYNRQFLNTSINRLVLRKADRSVFSTDEITDLGRIPDVRYVVGRDYAMDIGIGIEIDMSEFGEFFSAGVLPVSLLKEDHSLLYSGDYPENDTQILLVLSPNYLVNAAEFLGKTVDASIYRGPIAGPNTFTVVGIVSDVSLYLDETQSEMYMAVSDTVFENFQDIMYFDQITDTTFSGINSHSDQVNSSSNMFRSDYYDQITLNETLADDTLVITTWNYEMQTDLCGVYDSCSATGTLSITDFYQTRELAGMTLEYEQGEEFNISMNSATFQRMIYKDIYQISLFAESDATISGVMFSLNLFYGNVISMTYPYEQTGISALTNVLFYLFNYLTATLSLMLGILVSVLVTYLITRLIYNTKLKDYAIFRTIGANKTVIIRFIYFENILTTTASFLTFLPVAIYLNLTATEFAPASGIFYSFHFYGVIHYLALFGTLLLIALLNSRKYCRRIFKESVSKTLKSAE